MKQASRLRTATWRRLSVAVMGLPSLPPLGSPVAPLPTQTYMPGLTSISQRSGGGASDVSGTPFRRATLNTTISSAELLATRERGTGDGFTAVSAAMRNSVLLATSDGADSKQVLDTSRGGHITSSGNYHPHISGSMLNGDSKGTSIPSPQLLSDMHATNNPVRDSLRDDERDLPGQPPNQERAAASPPLPQQQLSTALASMVSSCLSSPNQSNRVASPPASSIRSGNAGLNIEPGRSTGLEEGGDIQPASSARRILKETSLTMPPLPQSLKSWRTSTGTGTAASPQRTPLSDSSSSSDDDDDDDDYAKSSGGAYSVVGNGRGAPSCVNSSLMPMPTSASLLETADCSPK